MAVAATPATVLEIDTGQGPARVHLHRAERPVAGLVLGHGAGGGVSAPDLVAVTGIAPVSYTHLTLPTIYSV